MRAGESLLAVAGPGDTLLRAARDILAGLRHTRTSGLAAGIILAAEAFAAASGYFILPCPRWETRTRAYSRRETRAFILLFAGQVGGDILSYGMYRDGPGPWLRALRREYVADDARARMLTSFDSAYRMWEERRRMGADEIAGRRRGAAERHGRVFRECPDIGRGLFFADQLDDIGR